MNKQTKLYLGVGLVALAGYLIWKNSQKPKGDTTKKAAGSRTMNTMLADDGGGGTPTGGGASTLPAQACNGYTEGHVCAFISPRTGDAVFGHCKATSGGGLSCEK
jgi:hypothetical protein